MACGVPVIGYRAGGLPEVVEHGVSGLLCEIGSQDCMGTMAADLLQDQERYRVSTAARRQAARAIIDQYEDLLLATLSRSSITEVHDVVT